MIRKKYRVIVKMVKEVVMDHEQESMEKALKGNRKFIKR